MCDDTFPCGRDPVTQAGLLLEGGVRVLQVRLKQTPLRQALEVTGRIVALARAHGAVCLVNDRVDVALLCGADGVHLGDEDLPPEDARRLLGPQRLVGVTVRDLGGAQAAAKAQASYVGLGPLFQTTTKAVGRAPLGLGVLAEVSANAPLPVVGIAGVGLGNIRSVAAAGAHGAAVVSELLRAADLPAMARSLQAAFDEGRQAALRSGA